jgi:exoribonuclease-2
MPTLVEYLSDDQLQVGLVTEQDKKKLLVADSRGRTSKVVPDKVLFRHSGSSIEELLVRLDALQQEVDVPLLWESLQAEEDLSSREAPELARIYFDDDSDAHSSAIYRALCADRLHFRRRGRSFEPRSTDDLERLRKQRDAEQRVAVAARRLEEALARRPLDPELCARLERFLRLGGDKQLATALDQQARDPARHAFNLLLETGHLGPTADLEVLQANLQEVYPEAAIAHAQSLEPPAGEDPLFAAFSIDDPETEEVDDVLTVSQEGPLTRVEIDIADVASLVKTDDPVDREALRRAVTVYLPTYIYRMLPERLGCDLLSLRAGEPRRALRTSVWLDQQAEVERFELRSVPIRVAERLDYEAADQLLVEGEGSTAEALRTLDRLARGLARRRKEAGAISFRHREWKIHVSADGESISAKPIPFSSASRALVAEMMILANNLAARFASESGTPIIYRVQAPPSETPPEVEADDPTAFAKMRGMLQPAALSLQPSKHWGLGLDCYTQTTSPLRRYTDLVTQRQLHAQLAGEPVPYRAEELLKVLATAEATEKEIKRLEATVNSRWALEYVARLGQRTALEAWIVSEAPGGGYRVEITSCGAQGLLNDQRPHDPGELVLVEVKTLKPRQGVLRLLPSG